MVDKKEIPCYITTKLVQIGNGSDPTTGAVNPPVYFSTAYQHQGIGESTGYDYSRTSNPTRKVLEDAIASLENGDQGFACSSGMAAIHTVFGLFKQGDEVLVSQDLYGGSYRLFEEVLRNYGIQFRYVDIRYPNSFELLINDNTKGIFIETPTNPLMQEADIKAFAEISKAHNLLLIVDNTFYTPFIQQPISEGGDIVIHSATKYLGGHNDVLAGLIVVKGEELANKVAKLHNAIGATLSPFDSWLVIRGLKTLALRMKQHEENARKVVAFLKAHDGVHEVFYPGRGGMLSFKVAHKSMVSPFLKHLNIITFAESLGGVESFITYPTTQTHADIPEEIRIANGICERLLRFSVGIEEVEDLVTDLNQALVKAKRGTL